MKEECLEKSTIRYVNLQANVIGSPHHIYSMENIDPIYVYINWIRAKVFTMRYQLADSHMSNSKHTVPKVLRY